MMRDAEASGALLQHPLSTCTGAGAQVTLLWRPASDTAQQWIEYSLHDNDFAEGTYGKIEVSPGQSRMVIQAPATTLPNFWRVVTVTASGEVASRTGAFVPCERPLLLWGPMECRNMHSTTVYFRWAPMAGMTGHQVMEFDTSPDFNTANLRSSIAMTGATSELRRSGFENGVTYYFRVVLVQEDGTRLASQNGWFTPDCMPAVNPEIYGSNDVLVIPSIGVEAPVNVQDVGWGTELGVPLGGYDVLRYNFAAYPTLQGTPGGPGPTVIGGHLDYYVIGPAVFWDLAQLQAGDVIEYWKDGVLYTYVVDWSVNVPHDASVTPYIEQSQGDTLMLITCHGQFDRAQWGGYDQRTLVHAVRQ
jgi:sortase A